MDRNSHPHRAMALGTALCVTALCIHVVAQEIDEYQMKAAMLYSFAKFVEWPQQTFKSDKDPMKICVLGRDPFGKKLEDVVNGKSVLGRSFQIADIPDAGQAAGCQVVFIAASEKKRLESVLSEVQSAGALTVGDSDGFANRGGMVNFKVEEERIKLEVNVEAAGKAKLRISAKVLELARIVKTGIQK